jgi:hypothetical protein
MRQGLEPDWKIAATGRQERASRAGTGAIASAKLRRVAGDGIPK